MLINIGYIFHPMVMDDRGLRDRDLEFLRYQLEQVTLDNSGIDYGIRGKHPLVELSYPLRRGCGPLRWNLDTDQRERSDNSFLLAEAQRVRQYLHEQDPLLELRLSIQGILSKRLPFGYPYARDLPEKGSFFEAYTREQVPGEDLVSLVLRVAVHPKYGTEEFFQGMDHQRHFTDSSAFKFIKRIPFLPVAFSADHPHFFYDEEVQRKLRTDGYELLPRNTPPQ
jgi:hypothetical protein